MVDAQISEMGQAESHIHRQMWTDASKTKHSNTSNHSPRMQAGTEAGRHTGAISDTDTDRHRHTHIDTDTHIDKHTHTDTHTQTHTHRQANTHTGAQACVY